MRFRKDAFQTDDVKKVCIARLYLQSHKYMIQRFVFKTLISNCVHTTRIYNKLHMEHSLSKDWKAK